MRRCCGKRGKVGLALLALGVVVILALILPPGFWLFAAGALLIAAGIWLLRG